jgi:uncharacterized protein
MEQISTLIKSIFANSSVCNYCRLHLLHFHQNSLVYTVITLSFLLMLVYFSGRSRLFVAAGMGWNIAASIFSNKRTYEKLRWALAAAITPSASIMWFEQMGNSCYRSFLEINPRLALKPTRVYLSTRWKITQKIKVLQDTYNFIHQHGSFLQSSMLRPDGGILAQTDLGKHGNATIVLSYDARFRKEGEFVLSLWISSLTRAVAFLSFSLESHSDGTCTCYIGCLQGGKEGNQKEDVVTASKAMHGLRPKAALVFVAQEMARNFGARELLGVGNNIQAHRRKHIVHIPFLHDYTFDYNATWTDVGGAPDKDGWYSLPLETYRHAREEIKTNKRSMYLKRYAMMDDITQQMDSQLNSTQLQNLAA